MKKTIAHIISIPFIWLPLLVVVPLHLITAFYQAVCFRLYGIERVKLRGYVEFDREKLGYLSLVDKINCAYCSYANGVFAYVSEVGHRTEYYWCGVKHKAFPNNPAFAYQAKFAPYGDEEAFNQCKLESGRRAK